MDRRKIVYYNYRGKTPVKKRRAPSVSVGKLFLVVAFIASAMLTQLFFGKPSSDPTSQVLADQAIAETQPEQQEVTIDSPLQNIEFPLLGQAAVGTLEQGVIKHTDNETPAPIASITKVITALVILEKRPIEVGERGDVIVLTDKDAQYFNDYYAKLGTVTAVSVGASMSQYEALQAILLPSSNNMSDTLVDRYFGSMDAYVSYANDFLKRNGLNNTVVADASGFSPESKSTPSDLIKLGMLALKHPIVREIVAQPYATLAVAGDVPNYNQLISEPGVIGIKPGTTDEAGYCLLYAANVPDAMGKNHVVIAVSIGQTDRPAFIASIKQMLDASRQLLLTDQTL